MKRSRLVLLIVGMLLLIGGVSALFVWNKPHRKAESEEGIAISADVLLTAYNADEKAADAKYLNKTIAVSGTASKVDKNQDGQTTVLLKTFDPMSGVFCTLRDKGASVESGKAVTLKGFCSGHAMDVLLTDCIIVK